jgi:hypothetical protein
MLLQHSLRPDGPNESTRQLARVCKLRQNVFRSSHARRRVSGTARCVNTASGFAGVKQGFGCRDRRKESFRRPGCVWSCGAAVLARMLSGPPL